MDAPPPTAAESDPAQELLRIQAAAIIAQQAALTEQEMRLRDREAALARQEVQVAAHLEDQRRQLLELQDQITTARAALRQKRAAHNALAEQQARALDQARAEVAELQSAAKADRHRLLTLRRRLRQRWHHQRLARQRAVAAQDAELQRERERLSAERAALTAEVERFHGEAELGKRHLRAEWARLREAQQAWRAEQSEGEANRQQEVRDLARRAKAVMAAERRLTDVRAAQEQVIADRQRERGQLETRIVSARRKLLELQDEALRSEQAAVHRVVPPSPVLGGVSSSPGRPVDPEQREAVLAQRGAVLARVADELADQRLHLAEQAERLVVTHQAWCADRAAAMQELEQLGSRLHEREQELARRDDELRNEQAQLRAEAGVLAALRLRLEAQRGHADVCAADRQAELDRLGSVQDSRERLLAQRESGLVHLYRLWGRRRRHEVQRLRAEQGAYAQERAEWVAARTAWLQAAERLHEERAAVAARALALEQWQQKCPKPKAEPPATAAKRVERLRRQWATYCAGAA